MTDASKLICSIAWVLGFSFCIGCTSSRDKSLAEITVAEKSLFSDSSSTPDMKKAMHLYGLYTAFAARYIDDSLASEYLFRAADLAQGIRHYRLAMDCYDKIVKDHPGSKKAAAALFMEGFVLQDGLMQKDSAMMKYTFFLQHYPDHTLAASAKALLDQLQSGLTDEELIKQWEQGVDSTRAAD